MTFQPAKHEKSQHWPKVQQFYWQSVAQYSPVSAELGVSSRKWKENIWKINFKKRSSLRSVISLYLNELYSEWKECGTWKCITNCRCHLTFFQRLIRVPHHSRLRMFISPDFSQSTIAIFCLLPYFLLLLPFPIYSWLKFAYIDGCRWLWHQTNILQR